VITAICESLPALIISLKALHQPLQLVHLVEKTLQIPL
jgi:hypothetical protein